MTRYARLLATAVALVCAPTLAQAQDKVLQLYSWANYVPPDLLKRFEAETGIKVNVDVYDSNDTML
ncbi:PotD/PotF family extracellular solute-binding protein, partial [Shewanella algae]